MILNHAEITTTLSSVIKVNNHNIIRHTSLVEKDDFVAIHSNGVFVKEKIRSLLNEKNNISKAGY